MARTAHKPNNLKVRRGKALPRARYYLKQTGNSVTIGSRKSPPFDPMRQILLQRITEGRA